MFTSTLNVYVAALVALWQEQTALGISNQPHPRSSLVSALVSGTKIIKQYVDRITVKDKGKGQQMES